jgi:hypothetical protein
MATRTSEAAWFETALARLLTMRGTKYDSAISRHELPEA